MIAAPLAVQIFSFAMVTWARRIVSDGRFNAFIVAVILLNAVLIGLETSEDLLARYGAVLEFLNIAIGGIFVVEISIRVVTYWPRPRPSSATGGTSSTSSS